MLRKKKNAENEEAECQFCKEFANYESKPRPWTATSITVASVSGAIVAGVFALTMPFIAPAFRRVCVPYVPATATQINNVMQALKGRKGTLLDIGSGDGRIVIAASKEGFTGHGVELNYWLVLYSRYRAWQEGQRKSTAFYKKDLWKTDFSSYNNIVVFGADTLMEGLEKKFEKEVNNDCAVLAARFPLPNWQPLHIVGSGIDAVWIYKHPDNTDNLTDKPLTDTDHNETQDSLR